MDRSQNIVVAETSPGPEGFERQAAGRPKPRLHVAFGIDPGFLPPMGATILSLLQNNAGVEFVFHVFTSDFTDRARAALQRLAQAQAIEVHVYPLEDQRLRHIQEPKYFTKAVFSRIFMCGVLRDRCHRVLYLDADIVCLGDLRPLLDLDLGSNIAAGVADPDGERLKADLGLHPAAHYLNSGVLYIDVRRWNGEGVTERIVDLIRQRSAPFAMPDQDPINIALSGRTALLGRAWNRFYREGEPLDAVLLHYTGEKPWQLWSGNFGDERFLSYLQQTPWPHWRSRPKSRKDRKRQTAYLFKNRKILPGLYWWLAYLVTRRKS